MTRVRIFVAVALVLVPALAQANSFRKGPYLQNAGTDAITVMFQTAEPTEAVVTWGPTRDYGQSMSSPRRRLHEVRIQGLEASTIYHYQVNADGLFSHDRTFTTAATAEEPFRFLVYGDNRDGHEAHAEVVESMRSEDPDLVVNTGDMVDNGSDEGDWQIFFDIERRLMSETPMYPVIGNHEVFGSRGRALFRKYFSLPEDSLFPEQDYAFTYGNTRFIVLTAYEEFPHGQMAWLRDQLGDALADPTIEHRFAFLHHGPYSSGYHGNNTLALQAGLPRILRDGEVDVVFSGHDHDYERGRTSGLNYIVSGGGGAPLYETSRRRAGSEIFEPTYHHVRVDVVGDGIDITTVRPDGSVVDRCKTVNASAWKCESPPPPDAVQPAPTDPTPSAQRVGHGCGSTTAVALVLPIVALALVGLYARVRRSTSASPP